MMYASYGHRSIENDDHTLVASWEEEGAYIDIEHGESCGEGCPIRHMVDFAGGAMAVYGLTEKQLVEVPLNQVDETFVELARRLERYGGEVSVPVRTRWSGSYSYWGEWDEDFTVELYRDEVGDDLLMLIVDNAIGTWHDLPAGRFAELGEPFLHEYLGWSWWEYKVFTEDRIIMRKPKKHVIKG